MDLLEGALRAPRAVAVTDGLILELAGACRYP